MQMRKPGEGGQFDFSTTITQVQRTNQVQSMSTGTPCFEFSIVLEFNGYWQQVGLGGAMA